MAVDVANWVLMIRTVVMGVTGLYVGALWLGVAPSPFPHSRPRHAARRGRPTWRESPLYHSLGLGLPPKPDVTLARVQRGGAQVYRDLMRLSRFTRQLRRDHRTVQMIVRPAAPPEEIL